jgi:anti-anti-sigma factor
VVCVPFSLRPNPLVPLTLGSPKAQTRKSTSSGRTAHAIPVALSAKREDAMPAGDPTDFHAEIRDGTLLLRGELDVASVQDLQSKIDEVMVQGQPIILDLAQLNFMDSSGILCLFKTWYTSGHPVVLRNPSTTVRRILDLVEEGLIPQAWVFDGEGPTVTN